MLIYVKNMITEEIIPYTIPPRQAVIAAFAQSKNDWNTWNYEKNYARLVEENEFTYTVGSFSVFKDGRKLEA